MLRVISWNTDSRNVSDFLLIVTWTSTSINCSLHTDIALPHPGTSSKSTKLVHGGVRYLQKAVFELDYDQYKLVREALHERRIFLQTAPYLSAMLPIMLPIYKSVISLPFDVNGGMLELMNRKGIGKSPITGLGVRCMMFWLERRIWRLHM